MNTEPNTTPPVTDTRDIVEQLMHSNGLCDATMRAGAEEILRLRKQVSVLSNQLKKES
jgi:hypothetical protein